MGRQARSNLTILPQSTGLPGEVGSAGQHREGRSVAAVASVLGRSTVPDTLGPGGVYEGPLNPWWEKAPKKVVNLNGLEIGGQVRLHSLAREPTWNGAEGEIENLDRKSGLMQVRMPDGRLKCISVENAEPIDEMGRTRSVVMAHKAARAQGARTVPIGFPGEGREQLSSGPPLPTLPNELLGSEVPAALSDPRPRNTMSASWRSKDGCVSDSFTGGNPNNWGPAPRHIGSTSVHGNARRIGSKEDGMLEDVQAQLNSMTTRLSRNPPRLGREHQSSGMLA